ncbi:hypothetical protein ATANTOWER_013929 [Ataeniobius toweri]|uniref:Uncharacterized protein n=1 Tax=Ataeniobius toweri TaxID=208326 RepID=A0ABU7BFK7_9TELE|nr:hypothetical protein [Ataeniobius toweri]
MKTTCQCLFGESGMPSDSFLKELRQFQAVCLNFRIVAEYAQLKGILCLSQGFFKEVQYYLSASFRISCRLSLPILQHDKERGASGSSNIFMSLHDITGSPFVVWRLTRSFHDLKVLVP